MNSGYGNTGDCNTGDWNTGDWNRSSFNAGCFNTEEQKITMFNKPSDWTYKQWMNSDARYLLNQIPKNVVEWVYSSDMTDEERFQSPVLRFPVLQIPVQSFPVFTIRKTSSHGISRTM
mgnify:CR=1 FL=1